jgi:hypothetical protein
MYCQPRAKATDVDNAYRHSQILPSVCTGPAMCYEERRDAQSTNSILMSSSSSSSLRQSVALFPSLTSLLVKMHVVDSRPPLSLPLVLCVQVTTVCGTQVGAPRGATPQGLVHEKQYNGHRSISTGHHFPEQVTLLGQHVGVKRLPQDIRHVKACLALQDRVSTTRQSLGDNGTPIWWLLDIAFHQ